MTAVTLTLHNLRPWAESYELTKECITHEHKGTSMATPKSVKAIDGTPGFAWGVVVYPPTITIPARGKVSGIPLAARESPCIKAAVAAGALRISEDGQSAPLAKKSAGKGA